MAGEDSDTGIKIYLLEIGQIPLLTPQEEIVLAARIKKGDREARALMIKANLRLVVKIARDYAAYYHCPRTWRWIEPGCPFRICGRSFNQAC